MARNENEFFREVTLRICGSLDIESALYNLYNYLRHQIPVEEVSYTHFEPEMGSIQFISCADREGGKDLGLAPMHLPHQLADWLKQDISQQDYYTLNRPEENPLSQVITKFRGMNPNTSILVVRLIMGNQFLGSFNAVHQGLDCYTDAHARLLASAKEPLAIALANHLQHREVIRLKELIEEDNEFLKNEIKSSLNKKIIGADFGLKNVMTKVRQVASTASPVLLLGETGTGKEVIANGIHNLSPRNTGPFVPVNCGAIPGSLIDSELFGHEKGAFTGAVSSYKGRFERANRGTIFLDEIGDLPLDAQVRLLRVLQEKTIERVGSTEPIKVDIRVIAATHRDLEDMAAKGEFRHDLLYRLKVFPVTIPPLRMRKSDIPALVQFFFHQKGRELGIKKTPDITQTFLDQLLDYDWPGNVRELENFIERTLIVSRSGSLNLDTAKKIVSLPTKTDEEPSADMILPLDESMKRHIQKALTQCNGQIEGKSGVAELLKIKPNTLRARMKKLGIPYGRKS